MIPEVEGTRLGLWPSRKMVPEFLKGPKTTCNAAGGGGRGFGREGGEKGGGVLVGRLVFLLPALQLRMLGNLLKNLRCMFF